MDKPTTDIGLLEVLMERLEKQRLPWLFDINKKLDAGESLNDIDLAYLEKSMADAKKIMPLIDRHPEYQKLIAQVMDLYKKISSKALQIEKKSNH